MRKIILSILERVKSGDTTPEEAYSEFIEIKEDLYSSLAKANNLVEIEPNVWIRNGNHKLKYRLTMLGFQLISVVEERPKNLLWSFFFSNNA